MRTREQIETALQEQMAALSSSCRAFDAGHEWEAKRIAASLHILLHDPLQTGAKPPRTRSLLSQLGMKATLSFPSYATDQVEGNLMDWHPLVSIEMNPMGMRLRPTQRRLPERDGLRFSKWWSDETVLQVRSLPGAGTLTRQKLIRIMRDQDGGSHFDGAIDDPTYRALANQDAPGWHTTDEHGRILSVLPGLVHSATVRTIAKEFFMAFNRHLQNLPTEPVQTQPPGNI